MKYLFENWRQYIVEQTQKYVILIPGGAPTPALQPTFLQSRAGPTYPRQPRFVALHCLCQISKLLVEFASVVRDLLTGLGAAPELNTPCALRLAGATEAETRE